MVGHFRYHPFRHAHYADGFSHHRGYNVFALITPWLIQAASTDDRMGETKRHQDNVKKRGSHWDACVNARARYLSRVYCCPSQFLPTFASGGRRLDKIVPLWCGLGRRMSLSDSYARHHAPHVMCVQFVRGKQKCRTCVLCWYAGMGIWLPRAFFPSSTGVRRSAA